MNAVRALGRQLRKDGIEIVTLESASDYWRIWFFVLEACGLAVQLVNAAQARNLPGRPKTDKLDAQWLARLTEMGLLRPGVVPPKAIRDLRACTRARTRLTRERTRCFQRLEELLEGARERAQPLRDERVGHHCPHDASDGPEHVAGRTAAVEHEGPLRGERPAQCLTSRLTCG